MYRHRFAGFAAIHISLAAVSGDSLIAQQSAAAVRLRGVVRSDAGAGIVAAEVSISGTGLRVLSDSAGAFVLLSVPVGDRTINVRRIGFVAQQFPIILTAGKNRTVALSLSVLPQSLPDVNVADKLSKPARYANTHKYDDFYARRAEGLGNFLTREEIDARFKTNTAELLQGVPGIRVRRIGNEWRIQAVRCQLGIPGLDGIANDPSNFIRVYLDGMDIGNADQLSVVNPAEIEAMEIYRSPSELPAQVRGRGCAAIFIWTRDGS